MAAGSSSPSRWSTVAAVVAAAAVAVCLSLWYLAPSRPPEHGLTGRVMLGDRPIVFGVVTAVTAAGRVFTAPIRPDGTYALPAVPPGPVRISVSSPDPRPIEDRVSGTNAGVGAAAARRSGDVERRPGSPAARNPAGGVSIAAPDRGPGSSAAPAAAAPQRPPQHAGWFPIPGRYASPATSGITAEAGADWTSLDLQLDVDGGRERPRP